MARAAPSPGAAPGRAGRPNGGERIQTADIFGCRECWVESEDTRRDCESEENKEADREEKGGHGKENDDAGGPDGSRKSDKGKGRETL